MIKAEFWTKSHSFLKRKSLLSDKGHLSNDNAAWLATQLAIWGTKKIMLGHLSEHNNTEQKAFDAAKKLLEQNNIDRFDNASRNKRRKRPAGGRDHRNDSRKGRRNDDSKAE